MSFFLMVSSSLSLKATLTGVRGQRSLDGWPTSRVNLFTAQNVIYTKHKRTTRAKNRLECIHSHDNPSAYVWLPFWRQLVMYLECFSKQLTPPAPPALKFGPNMFQLGKVCWQNIAFKEQSFGGHVGLTLSWMTALVKCWWIHCGC